MPTQTALCAVNELAEGEMRGAVLADGRRIALYNINGTIYATDDTCTHELASLSEDGCLDGEQVVCGWHFCSFNVPTGAACNSPCIVPLKTYCVVVVDGAVHVEL